MVGDVKSQDSRNNSKQNDNTEGYSLLEGAPIKKGKTFKGSTWRFLMLFLACSFMIGSYFCYDNPGVIE